MADGSRFSLVVGFLLCVSILAKGRRSNENQPLCFQVTNSSQTKELRCPKRHVIYSIDINSYNVTYDSTVSCENNLPGNESCSGLQPDVLTQSHMCYWNQGCAITFSNKLPIVRTRNPNCIGDRPSLLRIKFLCVLKSELTTMTRGNYTDDIGMIRSHEDFPWHYKAELSNRLILRPATRGKTVFNAIVQSIELDMARDLVQLRAGDRVKNLTSRGVIRLEGGPPVLMIMEADSGTAGGEGFVMCFQWSDGKEKVDTETICDKLRKQKKKKGKRKKGKGRKKKGKGNKKSKQGKKGKKDRKGRKGRKKKTKPPINGKN